MGLVFLVLCKPLPAAAEQVRSVLMVYGESRLSPGITVFDENIRATAQEGGQGIEFLTEFLDVGRFADVGYEDLLTNFLRDKYQGLHIDVVVAGGPTALRFLLRHREQFLADTPVVYAAVTLAQLKALAPPSDVVGVPIDPDPLPTLELALGLHSQARRLVFVTGSANWDRDVEKQLRDVAPKLPSRIQVEFLAGLPIAELLKQLRSLPSDTVVFVGSLLKDGAGRSFVNADAIAQIASASTVPVYGSYSSYVGAGIVGGYMSTFEAMGQQAGKIARRLLNGEPVSALSLPAVHQNTFIFDWRQLQRFGIDEKVLPQGSIFKYRQPSFWEAYNGRIIATILVVLLQAILIISLLMQRQLRRQAAVDLLDSEKRMNLAANAAGLGMWLWYIGLDAVWVSPQARALYGLGEYESIDLKCFLSALHFADQAAMRKAIETALVTISDFEAQCRVIHPDGEIRWLLVKGKVESDDGGQPTAIVGVSIDITSRRMAELATEQHRNELLRITRVGLVGQLSSAIAHELNQPMTAILANAQAGQRLLKRKTVDWEGIAAILKDIVKDDQRAVEVIRSLQALFNRGESKRQLLNLNEVVRDALKFVHMDIVTHQVSLVTESTNDLPVVEGDRVQLQQVLLNLFINACQAMAENEPVTRKLTVRAWEQNGEVIIEVADTGNGVDTGVGVRLFESFFTTKTNGMGMGLAISRTIIEAHGGRLVLIDNSERGATFRVSLPAVVGIGQ